MGPWQMLIDDLTTFTVLAGLLGLLIGSFLNVVVYRLPRMLEGQWRSQAQAVLGLPVTRAASLNLAWPGSHCPHCDHRLSGWENIPILSFLLLRGHCSGCAAAIGVRYPLLEAISALLSAFIAWRLGPGTAALSLLVLTWALLALGAIDLEHKLLPDVIVLPLLWLGLAFNASGTHVPLADAVWGAMAGYLTLWSVFWLFKAATGKDGMGYGDFKLLAALGAWGGWQILPLTLLMAAVSGALLSLGLRLSGTLARGGEMPFGPCLAIAGWIMLLWNDEIHSSYLHMIGF